MIETKEEYEGIKERYPGAVPSDVIELIEALREVVRWAKLLAPYHDTQELDEALDKLPDWITEEKVDDD